MNYKKIANGVGLLLLIALVIPFVIYAIPGVIGAQYSFVVLSGSMSPAIEPGDVVIVADRDPATIETNDVVTFTRGTEETPVTHRVVGVETAGDGLAFETKGDANSNVDASLVPGANVLGVVVLTIPYLGYAIQAVSTPLGFVLLVAVPMGLLVVTELWSLFRAGRTDELSTEDDSSDSAETASPAATATTGEITITTSDLRLSTGVLALAAPYTIYVALELQTTVAISVAFVTTLSALAAGGLLLATRLGTGEADQATMKPAASTVADDSTPATDGGSSGDDVNTLESAPAGLENTAAAQATAIDSELEWAETTEPVATDSRTEGSE